MKFIHLLLFLVISFNIDAQINTDFVVYNDQIWSLTKDGKIDVFDYKNETKVENLISYSDTIYIITKDKNNIPIIIDNKNAIKKYDNQTKSWSKIYNYIKKPLGVLFDKENNCYSITEKGIINLKSGKTYFSNKSLNHQIHYNDNWSRRALTFFMDKDDNIWIGFGYGEWGGDIFIFNTKSKKFIVPELGKFEIELYPVKSFFEDENYVYLSSGLAHMSTSGCIVQFDKFHASFFFKSESEWQKVSGDENKPKYIPAQYIGPATFNKYNNSIYFYSQDGIFKGDVKKNLSELKDWENIIKPNLQWKVGQPDAVGSPMNVSRITIIANDKFVIQTQNNGVGYFNGKELILIN
ncbi:hypothetical protein HYN48_14110 [Flavobacterium magnum]|uniref:Uncharacterized protein n=1 Tax=Flavobacterium magnum TaxID=2162713 RepID=A0A2S0RHI1_9FLAO|nr:hypothetical protein [Flavobacterium magnum]AWA31134.1 hypothetical protein HYN48_14110 [Flavobacterium magnum]